MFALCVGFFFFQSDCSTKRLLASQRVATISLNVDPGLGNLLTFLSVVSEALCISMRGRPSTARVIYISLQDPMIHRISWPNKTITFIIGGQMSFFSPQGAAIILGNMLDNLWAENRKCMPFLPYFSNVAVKTICMCSLQWRAMNWWQHLPEMPR